jgi:GNAT superfamily N-acetyltransferase
MTTPPLILERFGAHHRPLFAAWFRLDPEIARRLDTSSYAQARAGHDPYVACDATTQAVLGFGVINRDTGQGCFLNVITHPAHRRRGIARETIALLVQEARRLGYAGPIGAMVEATHDAALALARSAGFVPDPNPAAQHRHWRELVLAERTPGGALS